jgi:hypothetical protein
MIRFEKSIGTKLQPILDAAKASDKEEAYRSGNVFDTLRKDFHSKCYICEDAEVTSSNVEHFEPHKNDLQKKYDWSNLFFACTHCNNLKHHHFFPMLNCTIKSDHVWHCMEIQFNPFPKPTVTIIPHPQPGKERECENTRRLLEKCLCGVNCTSIKLHGASVLRGKMTRVFNDINDAIRSRDILKVKQMVADDAPFAGMLRWHLKNQHTALFMGLGVRP